ncbi:hypothetical protein IG631_09782 [Alternaria alternata]|nr:hypothetical protein IG631_09782 [Alternaria alternata]
MVDVQGCLEGDRLPLARMHVSNVEGCRVKCRGMPGPSVVGQLQCSNRRQAGRGKGAGASRLGYCDKASSACARGVV